MLEGGETPRPVLDDVLPDLWQDIHFGEDGSTMQPAVSSFIAFLLACFAIILSFGMAGYHDKKKR